MNLEQAVQWAKLLAEATPTLVRLWEKLGSRDAFLAALDSLLVAGRVKNDADLAAKHRRQSIRLPVDEDDGG